MKHQTHILTRNQWIGICILLVLLTGIFVALHYLPAPPVAEETHSTDTIESAIIHRKKHYYDSLRAVRTARYDSIRLVRRDSLHQVYKEHRDSMHTADSLWWDSVYSSRPRTIKKDTILELNRADTTELKLIRGIGSSTAKRIVRYREQLGGYTHAGQLQDEGLYMDTYGHSLRSHYCIPDSTLGCFVVCLDSVKTIPVNHASVERLQRHPYISHTLAKEIYTYRRQNIQIHTMEELHQLPHMTDSLYALLMPYLSFIP